MARFVWFRFGTQAFSQCNRHVSLVALCLFWTAISPSVTSAEAVPKGKLSKELVLSAITQLAEHRELRDVGYVSKVLGVEFHQDLGTSILKTDQQNGVTALELSPTTSLWNSPNVILSYALTIQSSSIENPVQNSFIITELDFQFLSHDFCLTSDEIGQALDVPEKRAGILTDGAGYSGEYEISPKNGIYTTIQVLFGPERPPCAGPIIIREQSKY